MQPIEPVEKHNSTRFTDEVMPKACLALKHCQEHISNGRKKTKFICQSEWERILEEQT